MFMRVRDVYKTPDHSSPHRAIGNFDAAIVARDPAAVRESFHPANQAQADGFLRLVEDSGWEEFDRFNAGQCNWRDNSEDYYKLARLGLDRDGNMCEDTYELIRTKAGWYLQSLPTLKKLFDDPQMGVAFNESLERWTTRRFIPALQLVAEIMVSTGVEPPNERELARLQSVLDHPRDEREQICRDLHRYYEEFVYGSFCLWDDKGGALPEHYAPKITNPFDLWQLLWAEFQVIVCDPRSFSAGVETKIPMLNMYKNEKSELFPKPTNDLKLCTVFCECSFDAEHGLYFTLENWRVVNVG